MRIYKPNRQPLSPQDQMKKLDGKIKQAAQLYEKQFLRQMVKAMRSSVDHSAMTKPGMAESIYREQLDDKYVDGWMETGGTGFSKVIYDDIVNKFYPQMRAHQKQKMRPLQITDRYKGISKSSPVGLKNEKKQTFNISLAPSQGKSYLQLPWQGKFEKEFELEGGQKVAMFSHPFGLKSTFVFQGKLSPGLMNQTLSAGENFAQLSPETQSMTWQVEQTSPQKAL